MAKTQGNRILRSKSREKREATRRQFRGPIVSPKRRYDYTSRLVRLTNLSPELIAQKSGASLDLVNRVIEREILGLDEEPPRLLDNPVPRFQKGPISPEQAKEMRESSRETERYVKSLLPHARLMPPSHKTYDIELPTRRGLVTIDVKQSRHLIKDSFLPLRCLSNGTIPKEWPHPTVFVVVAMDGITKIRGAWLRALIEQHPTEFPILCSKNRYHLFVRVEELVRLRVGKKIGYIGDTTTSGIKVPRPRHYPPLPAKATLAPPGFLSRPRPKRIPPPKK